MLACFFIFGGDRGKLGDCEDGSEATDFAYEFAHARYEVQLEEVDHIEVEHIKQFD